MQIGDKVIYVGTTRDPCRGWCHYHKYPAVVTAVTGEGAEQLVNLEFLMRDRACRRFVKVEMNGVAKAADLFDPTPRSYILPVKISS